MAILADLSAVDVVRILTGDQCFVMATDATFRGAGVVKSGRQPGVAGVAFVAGFFSGNVRDMLACCRHAIMTTLTTAEHLAMVEPDCGLPPDF